MPLEVVRADSVRRRRGGACRRCRAPASSAAARSSSRDYNSGDVSIGTLVLSDGLGLDRIRVDGGRVEIGAAVTMAKIAAHPALAFLHAGRREIGGPAVRAMATVGGNLFAPSPYGDLRRGAAGARRRGDGRGRRAASETIDSRSISWQSGRSARARS